MRRTPPMTHRNSWSGSAGRRGGFWRRQVSPAAEARLRKVREAVVPSEIPPVGVLGESYRLLQMALGSVTAMLDVIDDETGFVTTLETRCLTGDDLEEGHDVWVVVACDGNGTEAIAGPWAFHDVVSVWAKGPDELHDMLGAAVIDAAKGAVPAETAPSMEDARRQALSTLTRYLMAQGDNLMGDVVVRGDGLCLPERPSVDGLGECVLALSSSEDAGKVCLVGLAVANDGVTMARRLDGLRSDAAAYAASRDGGVECEYRLFYVDGDSVVEVKSTDSPVAEGSEVARAMSAISSFCSSDEDFPGCEGDEVADEQPSGPSDADVAKAKAALEHCGYVISPAQIPEYLESTSFVAWRGDVPFVVGVAPMNEKKDLLACVNEDARLLLDRVPNMSRELSAMVVRIDGDLVSVDYN